MFSHPSRPLRAVTTRLGFLAAVAVFATACAAGTQTEVPGQAPEAAADGTVQLVVMNNEFGAEEATILLEGGVQMSLGTVPAGQRRTFEARLEPRDYQLVARGLTGSQSIDFQLFGNTTRVTWDMNADRITQTSN